jgi:hypothetical protein
VNAYSIGDMDFINPAQGWAVGYNGMILHRTGTDFVPPAAPVANKFSLSVYPNPFNSRTNIEFNLATTQHMQLAVYDVTGRLVQNLADRVFTAGPYRLSFDGTMLASGMYFVSVQGATQHVIRKLVLVK